MLDASPPAMQVPGTVTEARSLTAARLAGGRVVVEGELMSSDSCHEVRFEIAAKTRRPSRAPELLAEQYKPRSMQDAMCAMVISWHHASITFYAPSTARTITIHTSDGRHRITLSS